MATEQNQDNALTDIHFWDDQWSEIAKKPGIVQFLRGADHGNGGIFLKTLRRHLPKDFFHGKSVVELGGACSQFLIDLARYEGAKPSIIESSPVGIRQTRAMFNQEKVAVEILDCDMFGPTVGDKTYDIVTHWGLVEHFHDPLPVLKASADLLKPGGTLIYSMPNLAALGAKLWRRASPENFSKHVFHSDEILREVSAKLGLRTEKIFHFGQPLFRTGPAENQSLAARFALVGHVASLSLGRAWPGLYAHGTSLVSCNRGFILVKEGEPARLQ